MVLQNCGGCCRGVMSGAACCRCRDAGGQWLCLVIVCGACSLRISMVILYPVKVAVVGRTRGRFIVYTNVRGCLRSFMVRRCLVYLVLAVCFGWCSSIAYACVACGCFVLFGIRQKGARALGGSVF